ncbi:MAG TPA: hypothetical protein VFU37_19660, partial [Pyrinomonadaceae bacterium]|nr:hypothetical protein [Pyrinomonadaceae bacterium]
MNRHVAKGLTMVMLVVGLALASAAVANGQGERITAQVPFDFIVADKTLSSGRYEVARATNGGEALAIRSAAKTEAVRLASRVDSKNGQIMNAKLVFHRYGETYFLSEVWPGGTSQGRQLAKSKQERGMERELGKI